MKVSENLGACQVHSESRLMPYSELLKPGCIAFQCRCCNEQVLSPKS